MGEYIWNTCSQDRPFEGGGGGRVLRRCHVSYVTGASNCDWLTFRQGLLFFMQVRVEGGCFYSVFFFFFFFFFSLSFLFPFLPCCSLSSPLQALLSLFSLFLGDETKLLTRVDVSLSPNSINRRQWFWCWLFFVWSNGCSLLGFFMCSPVRCLLCLVDSVWHCNNFVGVEKTGCFALL